MVHLLLTDETYDTCDCLLRMLPSSIKVKEETKPLVQAAYRHRRAKASGQCCLEGGLTGDNNKTLISDNYIRNQQWMGKIADAYPDNWNH